MDATNWGTVCDGKEMSDMRLELMGGKYYRDLVDVEPWGSF